MGWRGVEERSPGVSQQRGRLESSSPALPFPGAARLAGSPQCQAKRGVDPIKSPSQAQKQGVAELVPGPEGLSGAAPGSGGCRSLAARSWGVTHGSCARLSRCATRSSLCSQGLH